MVKTKKATKRVVKKTTSRKSKKPAYSIVQIALLVLVVGGLAAGLVLASKPTLLFPKASGNPTWPLKAPQNYACNTNSNVIENVSNEEVRYQIECKSVAGKPRITCDLGSFPLNGTLKPGAKLTIPYPKDWGGKDKFGTVNLHYTVHSATMSSDKYYGYGWDVWCKEDLPQSACQVGYVFAQKRTSNNDKAYGLPLVRKDDINKARPDVQVQYFDLYKNDNPLTLDKLSKLKALFVVDTPYHPEAGATFNPHVPNDERITTAEIEIINQAYKKGLNVFISGDNGKPTNTNNNNQDAASLAEPVTNTLQKAIVYNKEAYASWYRNTGTLGSVTPMWGPQVPLLSPAKFDLTTASGAWTPGYLAKGAEADTLNSSCLVPTYYNKYNRPFSISCLVGYVPANNGTGMMVVDANAGYPTRSIIGNLIDEACKLN